MKNKELLSKTMIKIYVAMFVSGILMGQGVKHDWRYFLLFMLGFIIACAAMYINGQYHARKEIKKLIEDKAKQLYEENKQENKVAVRYSYGEYEYITEEEANELMAKIAEKEQENERQQTD